MEKKEEQRVREREATGTQGEKTKGLAGLGPLSAGTPVVRRKPPKTRSSFCHQRFKATACSLYAPPYLKKNA
ncbi:unnamed protein product, partial [Pleuronectes platessa]